jgi:hypothetical protein
MAYRCKKCGLAVPVRAFPFTCACGSRYMTAADMKEVPGINLAAVVTAHGPGHELRLLMSQLGIRPKRNCDCVTYARRMDLWGVTGCRERLGEITSHIEANSDKYGIGDRFTAAYWAVATGIALRINPLAPVRSLVELAIERAEAKERPK